MRNAALILLSLCLAAAHANGQSWSGNWDTRWRDGGALLKLTETGDGHVSGEYPLYGGKIEAKAKGRTLTGHWTEGPRAGGFMFVLASDGRSFMGRFDNGEWWTGSRTSQSQPLIAVDQTGVRETLRTFVFANNLARAGLLEELGPAAAVLDFGERGAGMAPGQKLEAARALFQLIDLTTFHLWSFPGKRAKGDSYAIELAQAGTGAKLALTLRHAADGKWSLVMPTDEEMAVSRKTLLERFAGHPPPPDIYLLQKSARDTMTKFLSGFADWDHGGETRAIASLDTSDLVEATRDYEASLAAQYLKFTLDRIGEITLQEIPNDPSDRQPYVHFIHPAGKIIIAASGQGANEVWKFTPETVRSARTLYAAVEDMPLSSNALLPQPLSGFFALRDRIRSFAPALLQPVGAMELWQIVAGAMGLAVCLLAAWAMSFLVGHLMRWDIGGKTLASERYIVWPLRLFLTAIFFKLLIPILGWPEEVRRLSVPIHALFIAIFGIWSAWYFISALSHNVMERFERTRGAMDAILLSLALTALRLALAFVAILYVADAFSIPYNGLLAGLGIGGLAVAFASKETLSNVFGAGILVADRPFRKGDWIATADVEGIVEDVGIRSTRVRTVQDTIVVVPNGKLSDATITNWGHRRPQRLFETKLYLPYGKSTHELDRFIADLKQVVQNTARVKTDNTEVGIRSLGQDTIEVGISTYFNANSLQEELEEKNRLTLAVLALADGLGLKLGRFAQASNADAKTAVLPQANEPQSAPLKRSSKK